MRVGGLFGLLLGNRIVNVAAWQAGCTADDVLNVGLPSMTAFSDFDFESHYVAVGETIFTPLPTRFWPLSSAFRLVFDLFPWRRAMARPDTAPLPSCNDLSERTKRSLPGIERESHGACPSV
jgi:hypothetical protein